MAVSFKVVMQVRCVVVLECWYHIIFEVKVFDVK